MPTREPASLFMTAADFERLGPRAMPRATACAMQSISVAEAHRRLQHGFGAPVAPANVRNQHEVAAWDIESGGSGQ